MVSPRHVLHGLTRQPRPSGPRQRHRSDDASKTDRPGGPFCLWCSAHSLLQSPLPVCARRLAACRAGHPPHAEPFAIQLPARSRLARCPFFLSPHHAIALDAVRRLRLLVNGGGRQAGIRDLCHGRDRFLPQPDRRDHHVDSAGFVRHLGAYAAHGHAYQAQPVRRDRPAAVVHLDHHAAAGHGNDPELHVAGLDRADPGRRRGLDRHRRRRPQADRRHPAVVRRRDLPVAAVCRP